MRGLDTNVLVRYLVQDDARQGKKAAAFIESADRSGEALLIGNIVLCELAWVLSAAYGYSRTEIADVMAKVLQASSFRFESKDTVWAALDEFRSSGADFADCLIGRTHGALGCDGTATFDAALRRLQTFQVL